MQTVSQEQVNHDTIVAAIVQTVKPVFLSNLTGGQIRNKLNDLLPLEIVATGLAKLSPELSEQILEGKSYTVIFGAQIYPEDTLEQHTLSGGYGRPLSGLFNPNDQLRVAIFSDIESQGIVFSIQPLTQIPSLGSLAMGSDPFTILLRLLCKDAVAANLGFREI